MTICTRLDNVGIRKKYSRSITFFRDDFWKANKYESCNIEMETDSEGSEEEEGWGDAEGEEDEGQTTSRDIKYVIGDVTHPQVTARKNNIVIHCAGKQIFVIFRNVVFYSSL